MTLQERLRSPNTSLKPLDAMCYEAADELDRQAAEIAALREDAARLDWLEQHNGNFYNCDRIYSRVGEGFNGHQDFRYAIDLARTAQREDSDAKR